MSIAGTTGDDTLAGGAASDTYEVDLVGGGQDLVIDAGGSADRLVIAAGIRLENIRVARSGDNLVLSDAWGPGTVTISGYFSGDSIEFIDVPEWGFSYGRADIDAALGAGGLLPGADEAAEWNKEYAGDEGDGLQVWQFNHWLVGGAGNDQLMVEPWDSTLWNAVLQGGGGDDSLGGSYARDFYLVGLGDGHDTIGDTVNVFFEWEDPALDAYLADPTAAKYQDRVVFGAGITEDDVVGSRYGNDLILTINGGEQSIRILEWYDGTGYQQLEEFYFTATGTMWSAADAENAGPERISGAGRLRGTSGEDYLIATAGGTRLNGLAGDDHLYTVNDGSVFGITFVGGAGDDVMFGTYGGDTYKYERGQGHDLIYDSVDRLNQDVADYFETHLDAASYQDVIEFGEGITAADVTRTRAGNDLVLTIHGGEGSIRIDNYFEYNVYNRIEQVSFADGTTWNTDDLGEGLDPGVRIVGSGTLIGTTGSDNLLADGYGTQLVGREGGDSLGAIDDPGVFDISYYGGAGNDSLRGSYGRDFYYYNLGDGDDYILDDVRWGGPDVAAYFEANPDAPTYQDQLILGEGITADEITKVRLGNDLVLEFGDDGSMRVINWFDGVHTKIEQVHFADGTVWTAAETEAGYLDAPKNIVGSGTLVGGNNDDTILATGSFSKLFGLDGDDLLQAGGPTRAPFNWNAPFTMEFTGGAGDDTIRGSYAGDTYFFAAGDGHDTVRDDVRLNGPAGMDGFSRDPSNPFYQDKLLFGEGIAAADVMASRDGANLVLAINGGADSITFQDWFDGTQYNKIELVGFADGTTWTGAQVEAGLA